MDIRSDYHRVISRFLKAILGKFIKFGGNTKELAHRPSATTKADQAYDALHEMASQAERDRDFGRAGEIREALGAIDKRAVEALQALTTKHGIPEAPFIQAVQQPPAAVEPTMAVTAIPLPGHTPIQLDWIAAYRQLRDLTRQYSNAGHALALYRRPFGWCNRESQSMWRAGSRNSAETPNAGFRQTWRRHQD